MKRRSLTAALGAAALALTLIGPGAAPAQAQEKERHFAYLTPGLDLPFWRYLAVGIADEAKKHILEAEKHKIAHYMWDVAHVHADRLRAKRLTEH